MTHIDSTRLHTVNPLINDIVKHSCVLVTIHVLTKTKQGKALFDEDSVYDILYFLIGLVFYWTVIEKIVKPLPEKR